MPKTAKRNIKLPATSGKPAVAASKPGKPVIAQAVAAKPAPVQAGPSKSAERAVARDTRYLENAAYSTLTVTPQTSAYLALFAAAAKRGNGSFKTADFDPKSPANPESPKRNFRARAKLLADHGILRRTGECTFEFTSAITGTNAPANAPAHILAARTAYAAAK